MEQPPEYPDSQRKVAVYQRALEGRTPGERHAFLARDIMTWHPVTIAPGQYLPEIQQVFTEKGFRHLPVVGETGRLVGMVSDRDILKYASRADEDTRRLPVREVMTPAAFAATPDTTILEIARLMLTEKVSSLPILNAEHDLIGIVTTTDILKGLIWRVPIELWV